MNLSKNRKNLKEKYRIYIQTEFPKASHVITKHHDKHGMNMTLKSFADLEVLKSNHPQVFSTYSYYSFL